MAERPYRTIHFSELKSARPDDPLGLEWNLYLREVGRLIAEGHEGKHVLIKGETIVGFFDSRVAALEEAYKHFLGQPFLIHEIQTRERVYYVAPFYWMSCRT
jgi:hypothetical protein